MLGNPTINVTLARQGPPLNRQGKEKAGDSVATTSFWTREFLEDVVEALDVSLGRVNVEELRSDPEATERWRQAQAWLAEARGAIAQPSSDAATRLPPLPLTGEQLRALQRAVDRVAQERKAEGADSRAERFMSAARAQPPVTVHGRMLQHLERVMLSSWALAALLALICAVNLAELVIFHNDRFWPVLGAGVILSAFAIAVWWTHHRRISDHARFVDGLRAQF
jgi:hypothetical protein